MWSLRLRIGRDQANAIMSRLRGIGIVIVGYHPLGDALAAFMPRCYGPSLAACWPLLFRFGHWQVERIPGNLSTLADARENGFVTES
ncbi:MAG: hypothetical protein CFH10_01168 [Alphaproteobacteria bacterium MarineAlpha4_Bin2]|nr:MAG: hypothetical protein CFH10_01168 [Alphaproteobacteria bacterium MarineAlpha4_Bin2]